MPQRVVERLPDGSTMQVRAQTIYRDPDGNFIAREEYVRRRSATGYGAGGYGH